MIIIGTVMVMTAFSYVALSVVTQESRIAESGIKRMRALLAGQAGSIDAFEKLRTGVIAMPTLGVPTVYNLPTAVNGYVPRIVILVRGDAYVDGDGKNYTCTAASPSEFCIINNVEY